MRRGERFAHRTLAWAAILAVLLLGPLVRAHALLDLAAQLSGEAPTCLTGAQDREGGTQEGGSGKAYSCAACVLARGLEASAPAAEVQSAQLPAPSAPVHPLFEAKDRRAEFFHTRPPVRAPPLLARV